MYLNHYYRSQSNKLSKATYSLSKSYKPLSTTVFRRMSATQTFAAIYKERMMNMPDELNTKKDIDEYSNKITKEIKEEVKNKKIEIAEKKKNDKKKKRNNLDEDGNEKPKKALTKYQQYIRDNQQRIREEFPELSNNGRFSKLAEEWKAYKATLEGETDEAGDAEITNVSGDEDEKPAKPKKAAKTNNDKKKDSQ